MARKWTKVTNVFVRHRVFQSWRRQEKVLCYRRFQAYSNSEPTVDWNYRNASWYQANSTDHCNLLKIFLLMRIRARKKIHPVGGRVGRFNSTPKTYSSNLSTFRETQGNTLVQFDVVKYYPMLIYKNLINHGLKWQIYFTPSSVPLTLPFVHVALKNINPTPAN